MLSLGYVVESLSENPSLLVSFRTVTALYFTLCKFFICKFYVLHSMYGLSYDIYATAVVLGSF